MGVFPLKPGTKTPATNNGFLNATSDPDKLRAMWPCSDANIGFVPASAGNTVIDLDPGHAEDWAAEHLPDTMAVSTPRGTHLHYKSEEQYGNGRLAAHVDVRSRNGYVLLPPSRIDERQLEYDRNAVLGAYHWFDQGDPVALPDDVRATLRATRTRERSEIDEGGLDSDSNVAQARA
jgi:hypothetical protein